MSSLADPELGADIEGLEGFRFQIPRRSSLRNSAAMLVQERDSILHWCRENGIALALLDMANGIKDGEWSGFDDREWDVFVIGSDHAQAVQMRLRWS